MRGCLWPAISKWRPNASSVVARLAEQGHQWPLEKVTIELRHDVLRPTGAAQAVDQFHRAISLAENFSDEQHR
jgi:hypothetical protein